jgi:hypothetical protein
MGKNCVRLKICGFSGRRTDLLYCFLHQCAHWLRKRISSARVAGNDWMERGKPALGKGIVVSGAQVAGNEWTERRETGLL